MSGTLALATSIAALERAELERLVERRPPVAPTQVVDSISLALDLLREDSLARALEAQDRASLAGLRDLGSADADIAASLRSWGLVGIDATGIVALPEVTAALEAASARAAHDAEAGTSDASGFGTRERREDLSAWYAPALVETQHAAEILRGLRHTPGKANRRGEVAVTSVRALAEAARSEPELAARTLTTLRLAGLITVTGQRDVAERRVVVTERAGAWLAHPHAARWITLASARVAAVTPALRRVVTLAGGDVRATVGSKLRDEYPLSSDRTLEAASEFAEAAEQLGLTLDGFLTAPATALWDDASPTEDLLGTVEAALPDQAPGVYLQPDLSVVAPGPLAPEDEEMLFALAVVEQLGVASTFRLSDGSLLRALDAGLPIGDVRAFLERMSLTGIPQPLEYLLGDLSERAGSITVEVHHGDEGRSRVRVAKSDVLHRLAADRALRHLRLQTFIVSEVPPRSGAGPVAQADSEPPVESLSLFSPLAPEHVHAALVDARYPARLAADAAPPARPTGAAASSPAPVGTDDPGSDLVERVFAASRSEPGAGDFTRHLELAIRDRRPVRVSAEARGATHSFTLQPLSISGGRLRAADQQAGVERTLPITAITGVESI